MGYMQKERSKKPEGFQLKRFNVNIDTLKVRFPASKEKSTVNFPNGENIRFLVCFDRGMSLLLHRRGRFFSQVLCLAFFTREVFVPVRR
jgi:hypothetical protein